MTPSFPLGWRQVRVFTREFSHQWYFDLLHSVVRPFSEKFPGVPFWFTRYSSVRGAPGEDRADTDIEKLPPEFLTPGDQRVHFSLRMRFAQTQGEEAFLRDRTSSPRYWFSSFLDYSVLGEFGGERFCPARDIDARLRRTEILARMFHQNCLLILDTMRHEQDGWVFEDNPHDQNTDYHSSFVSVAHICANVYGQRSGDRLPIILTMDQKAWNI